MTQDLTQMNDKLDTLIVFMEEQQTRQLAMEELRDDMIPIANHLIKLTIDELAEIGTEFKAEDLLFLLKRLLRNTRLLINLVDQLEAVMGFADETQLLGKQVFNTLVENLDQLEQKGYFQLAGEGMQVLDQVVEQLGPEDVQAIGDVMLQSLKSLREPAPEKAPSMVYLLKEMNDPQVRIGLSRMLNVMKSLAN
ncbi:MAG: hypothetical protein GWN30_32935 [Gammaproteobacteria bacterium]|nr:hypothetical protein [Gammaproteobacteria bacterium]